MTIQELQNIFLSDRPAMAQNNSIERLVPLFMAEVDEFSQAVLSHLAGATEASRLDIAQEMADLVIYLASIATALGINLETEARSKIAYNSDRFRSSEFQTQYEKPYKEAKKQQPYVKAVYYPEL